MRPPFSAAVWIGVELVSRAEEGEEEVGVDV